MPYKASSSIGTSVKTKDPSGLVSPFIMVGDDPNLLTCRPTDMPFPASEPSVPFITSPFTSVILGSFGDA